MTAEAITVREAVPEDLETIVRYNAALARETERIQLDPATLTDGVRAALEDPSRGRYFLAVRDGRPVGQLMTTFEWSDWRNGMFLWIQSVYVDPAHRSRGVFTALYRHVEALARGPGMCGLRLYVHDENRIARETYRRLGMVSPGYFVLETPDALRGPADPAEEPPA